MCSVRNVQLLSDTYLSYIFFFELSEPLALGNRVFVVYLKWYGYFPMIKCRANVGHVYNLVQFVHCYLPGEMPIRSDQHLGQPMIN